ncbi:Type 1 glutamine amidotransferase-like domain-containing protein [Streptomyces sp. 351MFTsu5.1]|uniref:Type 1 glutamine amidotransferase-like domain-containing protein n=1 Tax=Streptomyces sp. 351MFTsu5.1 TaxID=1172180 RepID=UPI00048F22C0|nr:Type 1 glutamine amidotransferase-like domain-containing protein [Streptomyces sp. 351MFTsu5.1]
MRLYLSSFRIGNRPEELLRLLDGRTRTALVMNAYDFQDVDSRNASLEREVTELQSVGLDPEELDLRDYFSGDRSLRKTLKNFDLVYVRGGNTFVLRRALLHSGADELLQEFLAADSLVLGGYSAAAAVAGTTLRGIAGHVDDPDHVPAGYPAGPPLWDGLGLLPFAVAPHYRSDHPETDEIEHTVQYYIDHHEPFVALRDGEVIVVDGDVRVVG